MHHMIFVTDLYDKSSKLFSKDFIRSVLPYQERGTPHAHASVVQLKDDSYHFVRENVDSIIDLMRE